MRIARRRKKKDNALGNVASVWKFICNTILFSCNAIQSIHFTHSTLPTQLSQVDMKCHSYTSCFFTVHFYKTGGILLEKSESTEIRTKKGKLLSAYPEPNHYHQPTMYTWIFYTRKTLLNVLPYYYCTITQKILLGLSSWKLTCNTHVVWWLWW